MTTISHLGKLKFPSYPHFAYMIFGYSIIAMILSFGSNLRSRVLIEALHKSLIQHLNHHNHVAVLVYTAE